MIDRMFTNMAPLKTEADDVTGEICRSDHSVAFCEIGLDRVETFFPILLTHEGSHREVYRDFQPSLTSSAGGANG